jgi:hypothetical protein
MLVMSSFIFFTTSMQHLFFLFLNLIDLIFEIECLVDFILFMVCVKRNSHSNDQVNKL